MNEIMCVSMVIFLLMFTKDKMIILKDILKSTVKLLCILLDNAHLILLITGIIFILYTMTEFIQGII